MTGRHPSSLPPAAFRDYLLGTLNETESIAAEQQYFADGALLAAYEQAEDELIEDYLSGKLDATQRTKFETHYLASPFRRERYEIMRALRQRTPRLRSTRRMIRFGALAAGVALVSITLYLFSVRQSTPLPAPTVVASLTLPAIQLRGDQRLPTAHLSPSTSALELRLERSEFALQPPFAVEIRSLSGDVVWSGPAIRVQDAGGEQALALVRVPADPLVQGDYLVELRSIAEAERPDTLRYAFRVAR